MQHGGLVSVENGLIEVVSIGRKKNLRFHVKCFQWLSMCECTDARLYVTLHCRSVNLILTYIFFCLIYLCLL